MFKIELHKDVAHYYKKLNTKTQKKINIAIDEIVKNPFKGPHIKKLKGRLEGKYRYEIGGFRIIYEIDEGNEIIYVDAVGPRGDVYK